jgi:hypothetical protein
MKNFTKLLSIIFLVGIFQFQLFAQEVDTTKVANPETATPVEQEEVKQEKPPKQKSSFASKLYYGGNIGLSFGNYTMIGVYPLVGYKLTPKLSVGVKIAYEYISDTRYEQTYTTSNYGWSLFARYRIVPPLYVHIEYAQMSYELYSADGTSNREWIPFLFAGAGYSKSVGGKAWVNVQVLFDLLQDENSPYKNWEPFFSVGVGVGF